MTRIAYMHDFTAHPNTDNCIAQCRTSLYESHQLTRVNFSVISTSCKASCYTQCPKNSIAMYILLAMTPIQNMGVKIAVSHIKPPIAYSAKMIIQRGQIKNIYTTLVFSYCSTNWKINLANHTRLHFQMLKSVPNTK